jgi:hypothetical protein
MRRGLIIPLTIDPKQAWQTRPSRSRSFVQQALHLDRLGLARSRVGGSTADGMISRTDVSAPVEKSPRVGRVARVKIHSRR